MRASGSDVALKTADIVPMGDDLRALPFAVGLSRACRRVIQQNLWASLGMVAFLIPATVFGIAGIGVAVVLHEGSTLLVVTNALRLLAFIAPISQRNHSCFSAFPSGRHSFMPSRRQDGRVVPCVHAACFHCDPLLEGCDPDPA